MVDLSPYERLARQYACSKGIPLSVFQGRVPAPGEPYWLESDRDAAIEWQIQDNDRCSGCGRRLSETTSPEADDAFTAEGVRCHGCKAIDAAARSMREIDELDPGAGMLWTVRRDGEPVG